MSGEHPPFIWYVFVGATLLLMVWLLSVALGRKVCSIHIYQDRFKATNFLGLGSSKTLFFKDIDGFKIASILSSEWGEHEILYLIEGNKKIIRLSELYLQNYHELKNYIDARFKNLGDDNYNFFY